MRKSMIVLFICLALVASGCHKTNPSTATISTGPSFGAEISPTETDPAETKPVETVPTETLPTETVPEETIPEETVPPQTQPTEPPAPSIQITGYNSDRLPIVQGLDSYFATNGFFWNKERTEALSMHNGVLEIISAQTVTSSLRHNGKNYNFTFQLCACDGAIGVYSDQSPYVDTIPGNDETVIVRIKDDQGQEYTYLLDLRTMKTYDPLFNVKETLTQPISVREFTSDLQYALIGKFLLHIPSGTMSSLTELTGMESIHGSGFVNNDMLYVYTTEGKYDEYYADAIVYNFKEHSSQVLYTHLLYGWLRDIGGVDDFGRVHVHNHPHGTGVCIIDCITGEHSLTGLPDVNRIGRIGVENLYISCWNLTHEPYEIIYFVEPDGTATPLFIYD